MEPQPESGITVHEEIRHETRPEDGHHRGEVGPEHDAAPRCPDIKRELRRHKFRRPRHAGIGDERQRDITGSGTERGAVPEKRLHAIQKTLFRPGTVTAPRLASADERERHANCGGHSAEDEINVAPTAKGTQNDADE